MAGLATFWQAAMADLFVITLVDAMPPIRPRYWSAKAWRIEPSEATKFTRDQAEAQVARMRLIFGVRGIEIQPAKNEIAP